jgi:phosphoglucomutase
VREKDGLWAVLFWINLLAARRCSLKDIASQHWRTYGRHHYQRWDYYTADTTRANELVAALRSALPGLRGRQYGDARIESADDFHYRDPVDGSESAHQGIRLVLGNGSRIVYRLSGTGTTGATLRVYLERHVHDEASINSSGSEILAPLGNLAAELARIHEFIGANAPTGMI